MAGKPNFDAHYTLTLADFNALCDARVLWKPAWRQPRWVQWAFMGAIAVGAIILVATGDDTFGGFLLAGVVLLVGLEVGFTPWARKRSFREQGLEGLEVRLSADANACTIVSDKSESRLTWDAILRVDRFREHIILWTSRNLGIVVPERGFASPDVAARFLSFAQEKTRGQANQD